MKVSQAFNPLIEHLEGLKLQVYQDSVGYSTIGIGHLIIKPFDQKLFLVTDIRDTKSIVKITRQQAYGLLSLDVQETIDGVNQVLNMPFSPGQFDALVSLAFNIGLVKFTRSTLVKLLKAGQFLQASDAFLMFRMAGKRIIPGLFIRRYKEKCVFLGYVPADLYRTSGLSPEAIKDIETTFYQYQQNLLKQS